MPEHRAAPTVLRRGDRGPDVLQLRTRLADAGVLERPADDAEGADHAEEHDEFDIDLERAVRSFQQHRGITADGIAGPATSAALEEARWRLGDRVLTHQPGDLLVGDDVIALQRRLLGLGFKVGRVDGRLGPDTERAVREFQRNVGIPADGTCGPATLKALGRLAPIVRGGSPNAMRSEERIRSAGPSLTGKIVIVDAAASQALEPARRELADQVTTDLARRVESRLTTTGVQAILASPGVSQPDDESDRAEIANRAGAHLCISLHVDASPNPGINGVATYYYGLEAHGVRSWVGERFAGLVQREIVARTHLTDLRSHPRAWDLLRCTRMPAVRVEVGYPAGADAADSAARLTKPDVLEALAEAVVVAVQRLYLAPEEDAHTGLLRLDELRALRLAPPSGPPRPS
jgi:N-acetylmuramoyl-L-alanine amidase